MMVSGKKLVICDAETEYAARLAEYLGGKRDLSEPGAGTVDEAGYED